MSTEVVCVLRPKAVCCNNTLHPVENVNDSALVVSSNMCVLYILKSQRPNVVCCDKISTPLWKMLELLMSGIK